MAQNFLAHIRTLSDDEDAEADVAEQVHLSLLALLVQIFHISPRHLKAWHTTQPVMCKRQADVAEQVGLSLLALLVQKYKY